MEPMSKFNPPMIDKSNPKYKATNRRGRGVGGSGIPQKTQVLFAGSKRRRRK